MEGKSTGTLTPWLHRKSFNKLLHRTHTTFRKFATRCAHFTANLLHYVWPGEQSVMQPRNYAHMKFRNLILLLMVLFPAISFADPMECKIGPLNMDFGGNKWLVYACSDGKSIVAVSAPGNPAMPFFFSVSPKNGSYTVSGEGNGDKAASKAAYALLKLEKSEIEEIIAKAKNA